MISHDLLDLRIVPGAVLLEKIVSVGLSWRVGVGVVEQVLNTKQDLLDSNRRLPTFLLIQDRKTDCARWVDVRVEKGRNEFA